MPFSNGVPKPSELAMEVMTGKTPYAQCDDSIKSVLSMEFYKAACYVLDGQSNEEKRKRLDNIPDYVKCYVEAKIKYLLKTRKLK